MRKILSCVVLAILLVSCCASVVLPSLAQSSGTIHIRADGSIDPPTAPISTVDNIIYTFTDNIYDSIVVKRNNVIIDGNGHRLQGSGVGIGLNLTNIKNVTIKNMEIVAFDNGIRLEGSSDNNISENVIVDNEIGINSIGSSNNSISENIIVDNRGGIRFWQSGPNGTIYGNEIRSSDRGIVLLWTRLDSIHGNFIGGNGFHGIDAREESYLGIVCGNNISGNGGNGIYLFFSGFANITENKIECNNGGIALTYYSYGRRISRNHIAHNNNYGIYAGKASGARIYHNNLQHNTLQADVINWMQAAIWDDGYSSGNYWSDYDGADADGDGIGDTPYVIKENVREGWSVQDNYPLMHPAIDLRESARHLTIVTESPLDMLVQDPVGRRIGFDPITGSQLNEIPGGYYSGVESDPQAIAIPYPLPGVYIIDRLGTDAGSYTIIIESMASDGSVIDSETWTSTASPGELERGSIQLFEDGSFVSRIFGVIPEVPLGTIMASAAMIIALIAYVAVPKWRRKRMPIA